MGGQGAVVLALSWGKKKGPSWGCPRAAPRWSRASGTQLGLGVKGRLSCSRAVLGCVRDVALVSGGCARGGCSGARLCPVSWRGAPRASAVPSPGSSGLWSCGAPLRSPLGVLILSNLSCIRVTKAKAAGLVSAGAGGRGRARPGAATRAALAFAACCGFHLQEP